MLRTVPARVNRARLKAHAKALAAARKKGAFAPSFPPELARPERFELPTTKFVAWYSIQLSYGRVEPFILHHAAKPPLRGAGLF